jgi:hypothetical protein
MKRTFDFYGDSPNVIQLRIKRPWKGQMVIELILNLHNDPNVVECFPLECNPGGVGGGVVGYFL